MDTPSGSAGTSSASRHDRLRKILNRSAESQDIRQFQREFNHLVAEEFATQQSFFVFPWHSSNGRPSGGYSCQVLTDLTLNDTLSFSAAEWGCTFSDLENERCSEIDIKAIHAVQRRVAIDAGSDATSHCYATPLASLSDPEKILAVYIVVCKQVTDKTVFDDLLSLLDIARPNLSFLLMIYRQQKSAIHTRALLTAVRNLYVDLENMEVVFEEILSQARALSHAESCSLFLLDKSGEFSHGDGVNSSITAKVFHSAKVGTSEFDWHQECVVLEEGPVLRVALSGEEIRDTFDSANLQTTPTTAVDTYVPDLPSISLNRNPSLRKTKPLIDEHEVPQFLTRNILTIPLKNRKEEVIGVLHLQNRTGKIEFTDDDQDIIREFCIDATAAILHSVTYTDLHKAQQKASMANETLMYHMKVADEAVDKLVKTRLKAPCSYHAEFQEFTFFPRLIDPDQTTQVVLLMFHDLGFIYRWKLKRDVLARFILMVQKGYRAMKYHNWAHAFSVTHFCYLLIKHAHLESYLTDLEIFCLFVSCLCHDIDHRGQTNSFQRTQNTPLAQLYTSEESIMEHHHYAFTTYILSSEGCNIFENLTEQRYTLALDHIRTIILATDIQRHCSNVDKIRNVIELIKTNQFQKKDEEQKSLLRGFLMTCCDLADQTKEFVFSAQTSKLVYEEFFSQGDEEKRLGKKPLEIMDRENAQVPKLQVDFLQSIVTPLFDMLYRLFPKTDAVWRNARKNLHCWELLKMEWSKLNEIGCFLSGEGSLDFLSEDFLRRIAAKVDVLELNGVGETHDK